MLLGEIHLKPKIAYRLKVKGWENIHHANSEEEKKATLPIVCRF